MIVNQSFPRKDSFFLPMKEFRGLSGGADAIRIPFRIDTLTYRQLLFSNGCVGNTLGPYKLQVNKLKGRERESSHMGAREPMFPLTINDTVSFNQLPSDSLLPICGRGVERCAPILVLKIDATARHNELFRHSRKPLTDRIVERRRSTPRPITGNRLSQSSSFLRAVMSTSRLMMELLRCNLLRARGTPESPL